MKFSTALPLAALAAQQVSAHATFQALWVGTQDYSSTCLRRPLSNSPVENVASPNIVCNANSGPVPGKCPVAAGSTVTVEIHQQPGDRTCAQPAIGGQHYGPIVVYLSKVSDSSTADGSAGWFKIFENGWSKKSGSTRGDDDFWGVKDIETCCGRMNVKIPSDIPSGDYLLRAEAIALHAASPNGGAQFYMSCFQLSVTGGGSASPATVNFPGAYKASDPGIGTSIHGNLSGYTIPGPALYAGGSSRVPGSGQCVGVEAGTAPGTPPATTTARVTTLVTTTSRAGGAVTTTSRAGAVTTTTRAAATTTAASNPGGCQVQKYGQCGGNGHTGCTVCASGSTCVAVSPPYYSQCQ